MNPTDFEQLLGETGEIGYVEGVDSSLIHVSGLPGARLGEVVQIEGVGMGWIMALNEQAYVILLTSNQVTTGARVARTGKTLTMSVSEQLLGKVVDPLLTDLDITNGKAMSLDIDPPTLAKRTSASKPLRTGVSMCDLVIPISKGQRQLVIGDRKTGKTTFALAALLAQASEGTICIWVNIGKRAADIAKVVKFVTDNNLTKTVVIVNTRSSDPAGLIFIAPYAALTIAEYFRSLGKDTLVILDDMTNHARAYREISLLAKRFPGRNSYPGDIFNVQARIMERAGNFAVGESEAAITLLPIAQSVVGDLSGYIETNLMSMTDGHIFFDVEEFTKGRRPAINPFLSVTRIGHQTQSRMMKILGREVVSFLVEVQKLDEFMHFGAELSELSRSRLELGELIMTLFEQDTLETAPFEADAVILAALWAGYFKGMDKPKVKEKIAIVRSAYRTDAKHKKRVDDLVNGSSTFGDLIRSMEDNQDLIFAASVTGN